MPTTQECFLQAVRERLQPRLQRLGFKESGKNYVVPSETHFAMIGLSKRRNQPRSRVVFTVHVNVVNRDAWKQLRADGQTGQHPSPNVPYGPAGWWQPIGGLLEPPRDVWWNITDERSAASALDEVADAIENSVLPAMQDAIAHDRRGAGHYDYRP
ncbi:MAG: hypothetical protein QOG50_889 [Actinomycetota bacterium]|nr:hypothetical protein [Actinomycetota bacterium]